MDLEIFEEMDAPELKKYIEFLLWHYRVMDAFWFIYVGERFDHRDRNAPHRASLPHHRTYGSVYGDSADQAESDPGERKSE